MPLRATQGNTRGVSQVAEGQRGKVGDSFSYGSRGKETGRKWEKQVSESRIGYCE